MNVEKPKHVKVTHETFDCIFNTYDGMESLELHLNSIGHVLVDQNFLLRQIINILNFQKALLARLR